LRLSVTEEIASSSTSNSTPDVFNTLQTPTAATMGYKRYTRPQQIRDPLRQISHLQHPLRQIHGSDTIHTGPFHRYQNAEIKIDITEHRDILLSKLLEQRFTEDLLPQIDCRGI
jgi:hypothetical protein